MEKTIYRQASGFYQSGLEKEKILQDDQIHQILVWESKERPSPFKQLSSALEKSLFHELRELPNEIRKLQKTIERLIAKEIKVIPDKIYSLPSDEWELINPINFIFKITSEEVIAIIPELELYSEGRDEIEAVNNLKLEILDLLDDLAEISDTELGAGPKSWKKSLELFVKRCQ